MATEEKKVSKFDQVLNKIDAFFESLTSSKKADDDMEEDDDMEGKKADDEESDSKKGKKAEAQAPGAKAKKATDDEDSQDPDDDDDDDDDKDDDDTYGKKATAEIAELKATIAKQNGLLKEAKATLEQKDEAIRESIKSTFKPQGSQRSTKKVGEATEVPSFAKTTTDMAGRAAKLAASKSK